MKRQSANFESIFADVEDNGLSSSLLDKIVSLRRQVSLYRRFIYGIIAVSVTGIITTLGVTLG